MNRTTITKRSGYLALGGAGVLAAAVYLAAALRMPFGQMNMPGAGLFPVFAGGVLLLGSIATVWEGWRTSPADRVEVPAGANLVRLLLLLALLAGYLLALPWLGNLVAAVLFAALLLRLLSDVSWLRIAVYSVVIAIVLHLVFVVALQVPMPRGVLGL